MRFFTPHLRQKQNREKTKKRESYIPSDRRCYIAYLYIYIYSENRAQKSGLKKVNSSENPIKTGVLLHQNRGHISVKQGMFR